MSNAGEYILSHRDQRMIIDGVRSESTEVLSVVPLLSNLNPAKASSPDLLPARILKLASMEIAPFLCIIFQQ